MAVKLAKFRVGFATDTGRKRSQNQDNMAIATDLGLFVVAVAMGEHQGADTASAMSVEVVPKVVRKSTELPDYDAKKTVAAAITAASEAIFDHAEKNPKLHGMGTTTTALLFQGDKLLIGHVGDSRCYFVRDGLLWQLTRDHSLVAEKVRAGLITREQAKTDRMKNVITRSVGFERSVPVEVYEKTIQAGDVFLICSDGLSGLIEDSEMLDHVQQQVFDRADRSTELMPDGHDEALQAAVKELIAAANNRGGDDNITAVMIEVTEV